MCFIVCVGILSVSYANVSQHVAGGVSAGPVRTAPEDSGPAQEAADSDPR